jgi:hypothetical protein
MRTFITLLLIALTVVCKPSMKEKKENLEPQFKRVSNVLEICDTIRYKDSIDYVFKNYKITTIPHKESVGELVRIKGKNIFFVFDEGESYFYRLFDNYLIFDEGTDVISHYVLVDIQTEKKIASFEYIAGTDSLNFSNGKMYCYISNIPKDELKRKDIPNCIRNENIPIGKGMLLELIIYNFENNEIIYTGKFKCS